MAALLVALFAADDAVAQTPAPDPLTQSQKDGCQRNVPGLLARTSPEWAYVYNTPADQPPPAPRWAWGVAQSGSPHFQAVHTSGGDLPQGHAAYDFNVNLLVDPAYQYLLGGSPTAKTGNYAGTDNEDTGRLHTEWEDLTIPRFAWAEPGDRIGMLGSWVWDCGHFGTPYGTFSPDSFTHGCEGVPDVVPATPQCPLTGEGTEFHPYRAVWVQRAQASSSPYGENQADMFVSTDKTPAGQMADCAHKHPPPPGSPTFGPDFVACLDSEPNWQDVSGHYSFLLPVPPRPSPGAQLRFRAIDRGSVGAPPPSLRREGNGVRVTFDLSSRPTQRLVSAYTFFAGWTPMSAQQLPTHLRVRYDQLVVHRAMDPGCALGFPVPQCSLESTRTYQATMAPGQWDLYTDASGVWGSWGPGGGEFLAQDNQLFAGGQTIDLFVPPGRGWRLYVHGRECDVGGAFPQRLQADCPSDHELADDNDVPGAIIDTYPSAEASLGSHTSDAQTAAKDPTSTCPDGNPNGCYSLTYTVSLVDDRADRAAQLGAAGGQKRSGRRHARRRRHHARHHHGGRRARPRLTG
ncbi:MAG: hypothetical protein NVS2B9_07770 [Myxococcales bacterium]